MTTQKRNLDNENLLSQIEKMLSKKGRTLIRKNSLLGFCARLITVTPKTPKNFGQKLFKALVRNHVNLNRKASPLKENISKIRQNPIPKPWALKTVPLAASFLLLIALATNNNLKQAWSRALNDQPSSVPQANQANNDLLGLNSNFLEVAELKKQGNYTILQENNGFQLIEYRLIDGSKIITIESILF